MEKFAVDLEKVLDEFEFNEEREERVPPSVINNQSLSYICHAAPVRPINYRRPSFEPINLADADFAASPPSTARFPTATSAAAANHNDSSPAHALPSSQLQQQASSKPYQSVQSMINSRGEKALLTSDLVKQRSKLSALQNSWSEEETLSLSEEKPDLIDCDKVKQAETTADAERVVSNRLPDVTSPSITLHQPPHHESINHNLDSTISPVVFDLIDSSTSLGAIINNSVNNHQCNNINSSININNNINNKVNSFVVENIVPDDFKHSVIDDNNSIDSSQTALVRELTTDKNNHLEEQSTNTGYFSSASVDTGGSNLTLIEQQIGALSLNNNHEVSDPAGVEISFVEESKQAGGEEEEKVVIHEEEEREEEERPLVYLVDETVESLKTENNKHELVDNLVEDCSSVEGLTSISKGAVDRCIDVEKLENEQINLKDTIVEPVVEKKSVLVDDTLPVVDEIQLEETKVKEKNTELSDNIEVPSQSDANQNETYEESKPLVGFNHLSQDCEDEELNRYLEELEILEEEEKALSRVDESCVVSKGETSSEVPSNSSCVNEEVAQSSAITLPSREEPIEKSVESAPVPKNITRSLTDFVEKDIAEEIKEHSSKELQEEIDKQNALFDYYNSNGQQLSAVEDVAKSSLESDVAESPLPSSYDKLSSVSCASGSETFSDLKPLECQVAVHRKKVVEETKTEANSLSPNKTVESKESIDPVEEIESTSSESSSIDSEAMGNTTDKIGSSSTTAVVSDSLVTPSSASAVCSNEGWSSSSDDVKTEEAPRSTGPHVTDTAEDTDKPSRPNFLELPARITIDNNVVTSPTPSATPSIEESEDGSSDASGLRQSMASAGAMSAPHAEGADGVTIINDEQLGKVKPLWVPDIDAPNCMQCQLKFRLLKRRHHCRACGKVLCSTCCCMKAKLLFMESEEKVCQRCYNIIEKDGSSDGARSPLGRQPNPNNPMEYCSTIPPLQQVAGSLPQAPPSVLVPVGVLKREGRVKSDVTKQVMFSDGIRPGGDLTELDGSGETKLPVRRPGRLMKRVGTPPGGGGSGSSDRRGGPMRRQIDPVTGSFIPGDGEHSLPPTVSKLHGEIVYSEFESKTITTNQPPLKFAINRNLFVHVKRVVLECCVNRDCWCITSEGLACVGQDEIILVLECLPEETIPPKDVFLLINSLYEDASKGNTVSELSFSPAFSSNLLGSKDHGGFLYIRPTYQCTAQLILPNPPYLVALLIHRWETPWARLFPIRLELRLGAEFRYYPCPLVSVRHRPPLYTDIGHTIITLLADFRLYNYTLPVVRGLVVHMEDRQTTILIPRNRYDQVVRALNNSNDSVLPFGANFSLAADSHLVCMQSTEDENTYHTQAINIQNKPRKVTGASFVVFNGALKASGVTGKSSIVEDGLMVQVSSETMTALRNALRDMHDYTITCGPHSEETVLLKWTVDDTNFNIGVRSIIDGRPLDGVPSMRVHSGIDFSGSLRIIRWTEVFILQSEESSGGGGKGKGDPVDISRLAESLAQATCLALVPFLDLLATAGLTTIALRANIHPDNVGYEAGSNGERLPPLYMKTLDDELVAVVHEAAVAAQDSPAILELVFRVMES